MAFQRIKSVIYDVLSWVIRLLPNPIKPKTLLIIRTNHIGDYILWRNLLPAIRKSSRFKDYHISFVGNKVWKNLFDSFDGEMVDETIWMDMPRFKSDIRYRYEVLKDIRSRGFETVINTVPSRCKRTDDAFTIICDGSQTIGQLADQTNVFDYEKGYDKRLFKEFFNDAKPFEFEFLRAKRFTEFFLKEQLSDSLWPKFEKSIPLISQLAGKKYFIIFPGSSSPARIWKAENFVQVAHYVVDNYNLIPVICGSPSDQPYVDAFLTAYNGEAINLCGQTNLTELVGISQNAGLFISIDTGGAHIAAVAGCPVVGLYNGSHYGRFNPYPPQINPYVAGVYPDEVEVALSRIEIDKKFNIIFDYDYNAITADKVCSKIHQVMENYYTDRKKVVL